jgi:3-oxoacyl-[acyl-carrier protein] reductase
MAYSIDLSSKTAVVTGAGRGIGAAIALKLAGAGANIAVVEIKEEFTHETVEAVRALGVKAEGYAGDVSNLSDMQALMEKIQADFGSLDILVNNAGITKDTLLIRMGEEEWDAVLRVNLKGAFNCTKAVARIMMKQRFGRIVNMASIVGLIGNAGQANYSASKGGLIALTKTTAKELASRGVTANAIAPGFIKTKMTEVLSDEVKAKMLELVALKQFGEPNDIANAALFLCSDLASYITGQVIVVDGGMVM